MICPKCNATLPNDYTFCDRCGAKVNAPAPYLYMYDPVEPVVCTVPSAEPAKPRKRVGAAGVVSMVFAYCSVAYFFSAVLMKIFMGDHSFSDQLLRTITLVFLGCAALSVLLAVINLLTPSKRNKQSWIALTVLAIGAVCVLLFGRDLVKLVLPRAGIPVGTLTLGDAERGEPDSPGVVEYENVRFTLERVSGTEYYLTVENRSDHGVKYGWAGRKAYAVLKTDRGVYRADLGSMLFVCVNPYETGTALLEFEGAEGTPQSVEVVNLLQLTTNGLPKENNVFQGLSFRIAAQTRDKKEEP